MAVKKRLGEMLVEAGIIDDTQLHSALGHQRQWGGRLGAVLVELKLASEEAIVDALALKFGFEIARLDRIEPYAFEQAKALVPREYAARNHVFPMSADTGVLVVAMSDPTNLALTDELAFRSGRRVKVCIAGENAIAAAIRAHFGDDGRAAPREAIALDEDDTALEAVYDPIGATSSEQMSQFFEQPGADARGGVKGAPQPHGKAAARTVVAPRAVPPASPQAAARPAVAKPSAATGSARARTSAELQLEDQPTGSLSLEPAAEVTEELQPLDGEPLAEGEAERGVEPPPAPAEPGSPEAGHAEVAWSAGPQGGGGWDTPAYTEGAPADATGAWAEGAHAGGAEGGQVEPAAQRSLTTAEAMLLDAIAHMAQGAESPEALVSPAQLVAALVRVMLRKQWVTEQELLDEIMRG